MKRSFTFLIVCACLVAQPAVTSFAPLSPFKVRGLLPWHNFLSGPTTWNESDYERYLNPNQAKQPHPPALAAIAQRRRVWSIPWLEGDASLWLLQPRVGDLRRAVSQAAQDGLQGVMAFLLPMVGLAVHASDSITNLTGKLEVRLHDPSSIVKCGETYWMFSTGNGIKSWHSKDLKHWERGSRVFPKMPDWVTKEIPEQRGHFWAPDIVRLNDRYLLYYSVSRFGRNTSAIALASNQTLNPDDSNYSWKDEGVVIRSRRTNEFNAIDPAVTRTPDGDISSAVGRRRLAGIASGLSAVCDRSTQLGVLSSIAES